MKNGIIFCMNMFAEVTSVSCIVEIGYPEGSNIAVVCNSGIIYHTPVDIPNALSLFFVEVARVN
jgi:hypothetical protein